uniref:Uncharacterized protein LOC114347980 n=1 Tax=Diabrotica virgifera virgifera TaxID=50390 RepID=A0A6P7GYB2_DIAVI
MMMFYMMICGVYGIMIANNSSQLMPNSDKILIEVIEQQEIQQDDNIIDIMNIPIIFNSDALETSNTVPEPDGTIANYLQYFNTPERKGVKQTDRSSFILSSTMWRETQDKKEKEKQRKIEEQENKRRESENNKKEREAEKLDKENQ